MSAPDADDAPGLIGRAAPWAIALAVLAGAALRLDQIREQILMDDEWHVLHAVMRFDWWHLLTHFGRNDVSIPFAIYDRLLLATVGLSEMTVRLPVLLCGIASLLVMPWAVRRLAGTDASVSLAWLLAVSPIHVFFSRFARPYSITLLLVFVGALAFARWWEEGLRSRGVLAGVCFALGCWLHLAVLPSVLVALATAFLASVLPGRRLAGALAPARVLRLTAAVAAALLVLLGLPFLMDVAALEHKTGRTPLASVAVRYPVELLGGTARPGLLLLLALLAVTGLVLLARRRLRVVLLLVAMTAAAPLAIAVVRPTASELPFVVARYCLLAVPVGLLGVAVALSRLDAWIRGRGLPWVPGLSTAALVAALFAAGPLPRVLAAPNNWTNHGMYQYAYTPSHLDWSCPAEVPAFYRQLGQEPRGSVRILEAPWWHVWRDEAFPCFQQVHHQWMAIGFVSGPGGQMSSGVGLPRAAEMPLLAPGGRFRMRNFIHVFDNGELRRRGIRYVVFHKDLESEMHFHDVDFKAAIPAWVSYYRSVYGAPVYDDDLITVFDVTVVAPPLDTPANRQERRRRDPPESPPDR